MNRLNIVVNACISLGVLLTDEVSMHSAADRGGRELQRIQTSYEAEVVGNPFVSRRIKV